MRKAYNVPSAGEVVAVVTRWSCVGEGGTRVSVCVTGVVSYFLNYTLHTHLPTLLYTLAHLSLPPWSSLSPSVQNWIARIAIRGCLIPTLFRLFFNLHIRLYTGFHTQTVSIKTNEYITQPHILSHFVLCIFVDII